MTKTATAPAPLPTDPIAIGALDDLVGYHLRRTSAAFAADFAAAVAGTGMRQVLFGILSVVAANPGINQGNAGRALGIQRANMVSLVTDLVDRGLVAREVAADDRRAFALSLTAEGRKVMTACLEGIRAHEVAMLADLTLAERATLIDLLSRIERRADV